MKKKILSLLSTFCMIVALVAVSGVPVFALSKNDTQKVTVSELVEGTTVKAYKVIDMNVSDNGSIMDPTYTWLDNVAGWVETNYNDYIGENNQVTEEFTELDDTGSKNFWQALGKHIKENESSFVADKNATAQKGETSVELTLGMGEYVLLANGGTKKIYTPAAVAVLPKKEADGNFTLAESQNVDMKGEKMSLEKDIPEKNDQTVGIGSVIKYQLTNTIPTYPTNVEDGSIMYVIGDNMSEGLTFNNDVKVFADGKEVNATGNYEIKTPGSDNNDFEVSFTQSFILANSEKTLTLKYSATVNEKALVEGALENTATLKYTRDPYNSTDYDTITDKEKAYTYNIEFDKVDNSTEPKKLSGAEFALYESDGKTKISLIKIEDGVYRLPKEDEADTVDKLTSTTGDFVIKGLDTGTYVLEETKSPNGYVLPADSKVTVTLTDSEPDGALDQGTTKVEGTGIEVDKTSIDGVSFSFNVINKTAEDLELPVTGGTGIMMFTISGIILMGGAVLLYVNNRRKNQAK